MNELHAPVVQDQVLLLEPCPGWPELIACNFPTLDSAIYIPRRNYNRLTLARELGGRFDTLAMTPAARMHFMRVMDYTGAWWSDDETLSGLIERFQDAYADCALGIPRIRPTLQDPQSRWIDYAGYRPSRRQHARVCALIDRMGAAQHLVVPAS